MNEPKPTEKVEVVDSWLIVDGCKVARVPRPGVIAFRDSNRRRSSQRGNDQATVTVEALVEAVKGEGGT